MIGAFFLFIKKHLAKLIPIVIVLGLLTPYAFNPSFLKSYVNIVLFLMIYPMLINIRLDEVVRAFGNVKIIGVSFVLNFVVAPLLAYAIGNLFFSGEPTLILGLMLIALIPTSGMTASWTGLAGGNLQMSLVLMALNLLLSIVMIPLYANLLLGEMVSFDNMVIISSIVRIVVIPMILGDLTRRLIIKLKSKKEYIALKPLFGGISSFFVLVIVYIAMALRSKKILGDPILVLKIVIPLIVFYTVMIVISHLVSGRLFERSDRIAVVYSSTMRNLTIALGIALGVFSESGNLASLLIAIAYLVQLPFAITYLKKFTQKDA